MTPIEKRALSFFKRTRRISSLSQVYALAVQEFDNLSKDDALVKFYRKEADKERKLAEDGFEISDEEAAEFNQISLVQFKQEK